MKTLRMIVVLSALAVSSSACATTIGNIGVSQRIYLRGTTVLVFNATDDAKPVRVFVDSAFVKVLPYGENWSHTFCGGGAIFYEQGCRGYLVVTVAGGDIQGARVEISGDYNQHRTAAIYVRGDGVNGYRLDPPRYSAY